MNSKQKEAVRSLVAELRDVIPEEDRSKLQQLERIVGTCAVSVASFRRKWPSLERNVIR